MESTPLIEQRPALPQNFGSRGDLLIDTLVIHTTQAGPHETAVLAEDLLAMFQTPGNRISAHFIVKQDGTIWQCVPLDRSAWHAGNGNINRRSIGIECEGDCRRPDMWTEPLQASLCQLTSWLVAKYDIPPDRRHIFGHNEVPDPRDPTRFGGANHHKDPGSFAPWSRIIGAALVAHRLV